jgi:hypothetical protein
MVRPRIKHAAALASDNVRRLRRPAVVLPALAIAFAAVLTTALLTARGGAWSPEARPSERSVVPPLTSTAQARTPKSARPAILPPLPAGPTGPAHPALPSVYTVALPDRLTIPAIGVDSPLERLGLLPDHSLRPPVQWDVAGWYADGVRPGDPGPAVIAGHVDSESGPAVFYRLRELRPGAVALVHLVTSRVLKFVVDTVRVYAKSQFPSAVVYGPASLPELRLVTCTGEFDRSARSYLDNLVVTAHLAN